MRKGQKFSKKILQIPNMIHHEDMTVWSWADATSNKLPLKATSLKTH